MKRLTRINANVFEKTFAFIGAPIRVKIMNGNATNMKPNKSYLICATNRTGSFLLCEALKNTGIAGNPEEYFWRGDEPAWKARWGVESYPDYLIRAIEQGTTPNGVFGAKIMWGYFDDFLGKLRQIPDYQSLNQATILSCVFPNLHYIYITRMDKVRQAVSFWKAIQTNIWAWSSDEVPVPAKEPVYHYESIRSLKQEIIAHEAQWERYFELCQVKPFKVVYEDLVNAYEETALRILDFLKISTPEPILFGERKIRKQADALTEVWVRDFIEQEMSGSFNSSNIRR